MHSFVTSAASESIVEDKDAVTRSRVSKPKHSKTSATLVPSITDDTGLEIETPKPAVSITDLPAELRLQILSHTMGFSDLRSTILAHSSFYKNFHAYKKSVCIEVIWNVFRRSIPGSELWKTMWSETIRNAVSDKYLSFERAIGNCSIPCISRDDYSALVKWITCQKKKVGVTRSLYSMVAISICRYTSEKYGWDQESYLRRVITDQLEVCQYLLQSLQANIRVLDIGTEHKMVGICHE